MRGAFDSLQPAPPGASLMHRRGLKTGLLKTCFSTDRGLCPYLMPLSYGIPSAFGARDFLEVRISRIIVTMYGSIG